MRRVASAGLAEARRPPLAVRNREAGDIVFPAQPAKAVNCGIEDGVAVGAGPLAAFRAMALAGRADLPVDLEPHRPAKARTPDRFWNANSPRTSVNSEAPAADSRALRPHGAAPPPRTPSDRPWAR